MIAPNADATGPSHAMEESLSSDFDPPSSWGCLTRNPLPAWKRAIDLAGALVGLGVLTPVLLAVALLIKLTSRGPVFFRQQRYGAQGRPFRIWKFRTMSADADTSRHQGHVQDLLRSDQVLHKMDSQYRLIPLGRWLRGLAIDELPQLFNVLAGEMSLVGPRPDVISPESYSPWQRRRFEVAPGMSGLWQVSGKNKTTFNEMVQLDIAYIERRSLGLDLWILFRTPAAIVGQVLEARGARSARHSAKTCPHPEA